MEQRDIEQSDYKDLLEGIRAAKAERLKIIKQAADAIDRKISILEKEKSAFNRTHKQCPCCSKWISKNEPVIQFQVEKSEYYQPGDLDEPEYIQTKEWTLGVQCPFCKKQIPFTKEFQF